MWESAVVSPTLHSNFTPKIMFPYCVLNCMPEEIGTSQPHCNSHVWMSPQHLLPPLFLIWRSSSDGSIMPILLSSASLHRPPPLATTYIEGLRSRLALHCDFLFRIIWNQLCWYCQSYWPPVSRCQKMASRVQQPPSSFRILGRVVDTQAQSTWWPC